MNTDRSLEGKPAAAAPVQIHVLGRFVIEVDGRPLRFRGRAPHRPLGLLKALIALGAESVSAESLGEALWSEAEGDQANHALHTTLARLRQLIGADAVTIQDGRLTLEPSRCWVDAFECEQSLLAVERLLGLPDLDGAQAALRTALERYRGPLLDGEFEPPPVLPARERLHGKLLRCAESVGGALVQARRHDEAVSLFQRALERDDQAEGLYQGLMRACLAGGRTADGIAAARRCRDVLAHALSTAPSPETDRLERKLAAAGADPPVADSPVVSESPAAAPAKPGGLQPPGLRPRWRRLLPLTAAAVLLIGLAAAAWLVPRYRSPEPANDPALEAPLGSIAVLAFENLSGDPEQEYFSDAISDNLITALSHNRNLLVIARHSSFTYKGRPVDVKQIGRELGVRHVIEGSVQRTGERVRINVQLVDAATGEHVRAERYDRKTEDLFALQDDIVGMVNNIVWRGIAEAAGAPPQLRAATRPRSIQAADLSWRAVSLNFKAVRQDSPPLFQQAIALAELALQLEPDWPTALAVQGFAHMGMFWRGQGKAHHEAANVISRRLLEVAPMDARSSLLHAMVIALRGKIEESAAYYERATQLNPNFALPWIIGGYHVALTQGELEKGLRWLNKGMRLDPFYYLEFSFQVGAVYYFSGRYERALAELQKKPRRSLPRWLRLLAATQVKMGLLSEARETARQALLLQPGFSLAVFRKGPGRFLPPSLWNDYAATLRQAGFPD